ncbi:MAG: hypothetical protein WBW71_11995 [Bacteroidota bacterium]
MSQTVTTFKEPDSFKRIVTLLSVNHFNEILPLPEHAGRHFTMLVAMDGLAEKPANVRNIPSDLLEEGLVYLSTWGPDCGHVADIFNEAAQMLNVSLYDEYRFRSVYHDNDSLDDALWFFLNAAIPDDSYAQSCRSAFAVSVGNTAWESHLVTCLSNIRAFNKKILSSESMRE